MNLIGKPWDDEDNIVVVDEDLFDRTQALVREFGVAKVTQVLVIASRELHQEWLVSQS